MCRLPVAFAGALAFFLGVLVTADRARAQPPAPPLAPTNAIEQARAPAVRTSNVGPRMGALDRSEVVGATRLRAPSPLLAAFMLAVIAQTSLDRKPRREPPPSADAGTR